MADEKKEDAEEQEKMEAAPAKKSKLPIIIGAVVVLVVIAAAALYFFFGRSRSAVEQLDAGAAEEGAAAVPREGHADEDEYGEDEEPLGAIFPLETFVVNLSGGGFIRCQIQLEFVEREVSKRFYTRLIPLRDALISLLASKQKQALTSKDGKNDLKTEVKEVVNDVLKKEEVRNVYFTQFVVQ